ncbi:MAG: helix-turn-helix domain-containing protein [Candidatus Sumerlaeota bacterium]|nr:helix-turn-helix domain-containing protein [Candidatus Sumerlaeota bacterium]
MDNAEFVTVEELADKLKVSSRTIQRFVRRKELSAIRIGRQWRFRREWIERWLAKQTVIADQQANQQPD